MKSVPDKRVLHYLTIHLNNFVIDHTMDVAGVVAGGDVVDQMFLPQAILGTEDLLIHSI